jgi:hypothetical protein
MILTQDGPSLFHTLYIHTGGGRALYQKPFRLSTFTAFEIAVSGHALERMSLDAKIIQQVNT